ncbi:MAG: hypothetical protein R2749_07715 [Acidimicrobiales bacterium]
MAVAAPGPAGDTVANSVPCTFQAAAARPAAIEPLSPEPALRSNSVTLPGYRCSPAAPSRRCHR